MSNPAQDALQALAPGRLGIAQAISLMMAKDPAQAPAVAHDWQELLCVSSVAFTQYIYDPMINPAYEPERHYSWAAQLLSNWGSFESMGHYTGWEVKEFNFLSQEDYWSILRYELGQGRPVLTLGLGARELNPALIVALSEPEDPQQRQVVVVRAGSALDAPESVPMWTMHDAQGEDEMFSNWLVVVRPGQPAPWSGSATKQRLRMLRWVTQHARNLKEFFHETRENYSPGLRGFERAAALMAQADQLVGAQAFWLEHLYVLGHARAAASNKLRCWAQELDQADDVELLDAAALAGCLVAAADAYARGSQALLGCLDAEIRWPLIAQRYGGEIFAAESEAIAALEAGLAHVNLGF